MSATGSSGSSEQYHDLSPVTDNLPSREKSAPPPRPPPPAGGRDDAPVSKSSFFSTLDWHDETEPGGVIATDDGADSTDVGMRRRPLDGYNDGFEQLGTAPVGSKDDQDSGTVDSGTVDSHGLIDDSDDDSACLDGPPAEPVADLLNMGGADVDGAAQQIDLLEMGSAEPSFYDQLVGDSVSKPPSVVTSQNLLGDDFSMFPQMVPPAAPTLVMPPNTFGGSAEFGNFDVFQSSTETGAAASDTNVNPVGSANAGNAMFDFMKTNPTSSGRSVESDLMSGWDVNHLNVANNIPRISSSQEINSGFGTATAGGMIPRNNSVPAGFSNGGATQQPKPDPFAALGRSSILVLPACMVNSHCME